MLCLSRVTHLDRTLTQASKGTVLGWHRPDQSVRAQFQVCIEGMTKQYGKKPECEEWLWRSCTANSPV